MHEHEQVADGDARGPPTEDDPQEHEDREVHDDSANDRLEQAHVRDECRGDVETEDHHVAPPCVSGTPGGVRRERLVDLDGLATSVATCA